MVETTRIALLSRETVFPYIVRGERSAWALIQATFTRACADPAIYLVAHVGTGAAGREDRVSLLVTGRDCLSVMVKLPIGTRMVSLQTPACDQQLHLRRFSIEPIGPFRRWYRMWRRLLHVYHSQPRQCLEDYGLGLLTPLRGLSRAYDQANRLLASVWRIDYGAWAKYFDAISPSEQRRIRRHSKRWKASGSVEVVVPITDPGARQLLAGTLASLADQHLRPSQVALLVRAGCEDSLRMAASVAHHSPLPCQIVAKLPEIAIDSWSVLLPPGMRLASHALYAFWAAVLAAPERALIYSDHDRIDAEGRRISPVFKPDWSPELLRATGYLGEVLMVRSGALRAIGETAVLEGQQEGGHELQLRFTEALTAARIHHLPAVLWHRTIGRERGCVAAVRAHLDRMGVAADVEPSTRSHCRVRYRLPQRAPLISVIIPTRDQIAYLRSCIRSLLDVSTYENFEVLIVDNQSIESETSAFFEEVSEHDRLRVLPFDRPFNYSAINNFAAAQARGEVLCLLNNDTQVISPDWMEEMVGRLLQPEVGVVGAKLYYSDGRVQHAGDTVGLDGFADHLHSMIPHDAPGYADRAILAQELSAVTGACLMTRRELFERLGGLDEVRLPVSFNDVDYCLRVREAGWRVQWTPYAELFHHESVSRGKDETPEQRITSAGERKYMRERWGHLQDPFYNPNLNAIPPDFSLSPVPRVTRQW
jgi:O-antigen biosynthesis protein